MVETLLGTKVIRILNEDYNLILRYQYAKHEWNKTNAEFIHEIIIGKIKISELDKFKKGDKIGDTIDDKFILSSFPVSHFKFKSKPE